MPIPGNLLSATTEQVDPSTSGWRAHLNCTIALASGGRSGDGLLKLTSVAAGEMQARTAASYPVTPGEVYWTFADAAGGTVPERIGIRWLQQTATWPTTTTELSITWSVTTATASLVLHRISVAGVAPAGATHAQVLVSSTPAAGGVLQYFEHVYLGYPIRFPGSLLSFNAESGGELDLSAWAVEANGTLSRTVPVVQWPITWYYAGGEMLALTVTANGDASALCVERPPVTPGVDYTAYTYLSPPTTGSTVWVELRYYDATDTEIEAHQSILAAATTGFQRQVASAVAPPTAVTASIAIGITGATAGQVVRAEGSVVSTVEIAMGALMPTGTVLPLADSEFEQGVSGWSVASGVATIARSTPWGAQAHVASYSMQVSSASATSSAVRSVARYPVVAGQPYRIKAWLNETAGGVSYNHGPRWYDDTDTLISAEFSPSPYLVPGGGWTWASEDFEAPAGAVSAEIELSVTATAPSTVLYVDSVAMWPVLPLMEATADDATASVQVILRELEVGGRVTVYRNLTDGSRTLVRGPDGLLNSEEITGDSMVIEDYEAPIGVDVLYTAHLTDADGLSGSVTRDSEWVTITPGNKHLAWLKDPSQPQRNMLVLLMAAPDWQRTIQQTAHQVRGRRNPVVLSDTRSGLNGTLVADTLTDADRANLHWLLDTGNPLLLQTNTNLGLEDVYVAVGESTEARMNPWGGHPRRRWTLPLTQVDMPTHGQSGSATRTWQDVAVENTTWQEVLDRYATWMDVLLDQRSGG